MLPQLKELEGGCWLGLVELEESLAVTSKSLGGAFEGYN